MSLLQTYLTVHQESVLLWNVIKFDVIVPHNLLMLPTLARRQQTGYCK